MDLLTRLKEEPLPFAALLGIEIVSAAPDKIVAEMTVRDELCTRPAVLHGGAIMAFADTLGALGTLANLMDGVDTTTIESKQLHRRRSALGSLAKRRPCIGGAERWSGRRASQEQMASSSRW